MKKNPYKQQQVEYLLECIMNLPKACWGACGYDETAQDITMLCRYNVREMLPYNPSGHPEYLKDLLSLSDEDIMAFIFKNIRSFNYYQHIPTGSPYDCSGQLCGQGLTVKKYGDSIIIIRSASFDF